MLRHADGAPAVLAISYDDEELAAPPEVVFEAPISPIDALEVDPEDADLNAPEEVAP